MFEVEVAARVCAGPVELDAVLDESGAEGWDGCAIERIGAGKIFEGVVPTVGVSVDEAVVGTNNKWSRFVDIREFH